VVVHAGSEPHQNWSGSCVLVPGDWEEFIAAGDQHIEIFSHTFDAMPRLLKDGHVSDLCQPTIEIMAEVFGMPADELYARWETLEQERLAALSSYRLPPRPVSLTSVLAVIGGSHNTVEPAFPGTEIASSGVVLDDPDLYSISAEFRMNDKGGLHARTAVQLQQALTPLRESFIHVEAAHLGDARVARLYREKTSPAFWLLLLRLEARRGEVVRFSAVAQTQEQAEEALAAVERVLGKPKPERHDYWRELGPDEYFHRYFDELLRPDARELRARWRLFDKAVQDTGPPPLTGTPMAERV
jgi:phosphotransferase system HPr-like phosphotransfer protein